jgi:hypothetical protein
MWTASYRESSGNIGVSSRLEYIVSAGRLLRRISAAALAAEM